MALQGTLDTFALPEVLRLLAATRKTGELRITSDRGSGSVWLNGGSIGGIDVPHAPHATALVDALFETLRFDEGSFTFDPDVVLPVSDVVGDLETLLTEAEAVLAEWREIESIVPSMDAWVTLRRSLADDSVSIDQSLWTTIVAVGSGVTVHQMSGALRLAELPVSRCVRDLHQRGLVDIEAAAPSGLGREGAIEERPSMEPSEDVPLEVLSRPAGSTGDDPGLLASDAASAESAGEDLLPSARPLRARRTKGAAHLAPSGEPEPFVPLDLPGQGSAASYDDPPAEPSEDVREGDAEEPEIGELAAAFPSLAKRSVEPMPDTADEEPDRRLAALSPSGAEALRAVAQAATLEELGETDVGGDVEAADDVEPVGRGLLLRRRSTARG